MIIIHISCRRSCLHLKMKKVLVVLSVILNFLVLSVSFLLVPAWSNWMNCGDELPNCDRRRVRQCSAGEGFQCILNSANIIYEQRTTTGCFNTSCAEKNKWINIRAVRLCEGDCYDSTRTQRVDCVDGPIGCSRTDYVWCYIASSCSGVWTASESPSECSASCGGGTQQQTLTCIEENTGYSSYNCRGTNGNVNAKTILSKPCNTLSCPSWSSWASGSASSCSASCGYGIQTVSTNCTYKSKLSTLCDGQNSIRSKVRVCHANLSCLKSSERTPLISPIAVLLKSTPTTKSRTNQLASATVTPLSTEKSSSFTSDFNEIQSKPTAQKPCSIVQPCQTWSAWIAISTCSVTCGVGVQEFTSSCKYDEELSDLCKGSKFSQRNRSLSCNTEKCPASSSTGENNNLSLVSIVVPVIVCLVIFVVLVLVLFKYIKNKRSVDIEKMKKKGPRLQANNNNKPIPLEETSPQRKAMPILIEADRDYSKLALRQAIPEGQSKAGEYLVLDGIPQKHKSYDYISPNDVQERGKQRKTRNTALYEDDSCSYEDYVVVSDAQQTEHKTRNLQRKNNSSYEDYL